MFNRSTCIRLAIFFLISPFFNNATAECRFTADSLLQQTVSVVLPIQGTALTIGADTPNGTTIFRQHYPTRTIDATVRCDSVGLFSYEFFFSSAPLPLANWNTGPYAGKTYETGVPGLGVAMWQGGNAFPYSRPTTACTNSSSCKLPAVNFSNDMSIIKIGPVSPGTILGSNLPCLSLGVSQTGNFVEFSQTCFSGAINIVSQTCTTPDVNVDMGIYDIGNSFNSIGSTTKWKDASIVLYNCPRFYGTLNDGQKTYASDDGSFGVGNITRNVIALKLTPNTNILDGANGVMALKSSPDSASGIGIQLAYGTESDSSPQPVNFQTQNSYPQESSSITEVRLPLVARYIQTDSVVTPGKADGTVTFTITYN